MRSPEGTPAPAPGDSAVDVREPRRYPLRKSAAALRGFGIVAHHGVITPGQYSHLVAAVIGSAVIPTLVANAFFMPHHLLPASASAEATSARGAGAPDYPLRKSAAAVPAAPAGGGVRGWGRDGLGTGA